MRHLGIELDRRADSPQYKRLVETRARDTVTEFARRWMREQGAPLRHPIHVGFAGAAPAPPEDGVRH